MRRFHQLLIARPGSRSVAVHSGWAVFTQCANAEPKRVSDTPEQVKRAEELMEHAGYVIGTPTERGARRWWRSPAV